MPSAARPSAWRMCCSSLGVQSLIALPCAEFPDHRATAAVARGPRCARARGVPLLAQPIDGLAERFHVLEAPVHGGKAHVGYLVKMPQFFHDQLAHLPRRYFALSQHPQPVTDARYGRLYRITADRSLLQRLDHAGRQLGFIERFAAAVALDHARQQQFGRLEGGEALAAIQTLTPPADLPAVAGQARVGYTGVGVIAEGQCTRGRPPRRITRRTPGIARTAQAPARARALTTGSAAFGIDARQRSSRPPAPARPHGSRGWWRRPFRCAGRWRWWADAGRWERHSC